jgi:hypothetical protein
MQSYLVKIYRIKIGNFTVGIKKLFLSQQSVKILNINKRKYRKQQLIYTKRTSKQSKKTISGPASD